jgi:hypothetical protein
MRSLSFRGQQTYEGNRGARQQPRHTVQRPVSLRCRHIYKKDSGLLRIENDNAGRARKKQTNIAQSVIGDIPAQIANIEYKVTISGRAPSRYKKREEATGKTTQARTTDPTYIFVDMMIAVIQ